MRPAIFIGDELTAAGFRLAGVETIVPKPGAIAATLEDARSRAGLVIMTADLARELPAAEQEQASLAEAPIFAVIPDVRFRAAAPDLARRLRSALGIET